ncbi:hypothetical protein COV06_03830 [Candidatus Uhrbacteria bacterium CG10_big_fil_rev_8_21_14_0_10_50_16]|uniref:UDP-N-acetylglucosamine--N-acetylmuramyl-(pentapeptide) pyrophosphoryl-undecaprenol N-acetylglucosamine transferase n=1 Tax=Candidatus Uhrbacteria bacterium CG10_big_fil_rev_8_21_14_0_10_50_16 TaxID=1975039 RepID=A0A2H0RLG1_9BACT|nr:MAG: hypothetical protein COV06_03830 [Candidatus Uhrbacteria bacterium CG10_big_fil_rev_8_21_14_0_10_50_16]
MKILLSGGGTLGPVTPLLGLVEYWRAHNKLVDLVWVGTVHGPEANMVTSQDVRFISIASVKIPRYVSFYWLTIPFRLVYAGVEAWNVLKAEQPDVIVTAGGYVSVPLVILGRFMGIRSWVHQQDVLPGLANKIMARFAAKISTTFDASKDVFPSKKTEVTGNAVRESMLQGSRERALLKFGLSPERKTLLVLGGGGGAMWLNESVSAIAADLTKKWQVLHVTGRDKHHMVNVSDKYYVTEPLINDGMDDAYAIADVVLCRAGLGTLTELAAVGKPAIVVPIPDSHQEMNAFHLYEHQAGLILDQTETTPQILLSSIRTVMDNEDVQMRFAANLKLTFPKDGTKKIAEGVLKLAGESDAKWSRERKDPSPLERFLEEGEEGYTTGMTEHSQERVEEDVQQEEQGSEPLPLSIQEQVARALGNTVVHVEEASEEDYPFETKEL